MARACDSSRPELPLTLPRARGLFIAGTDTEVGKTLVAGGIGRILREIGRRVGVFKPVASGCRRSREGLVSADAEFLAYCADTDVPLSVVNPVSYVIPAAPVVCEPREHRPVDFEAIRLAYEHLVASCECVLVEGIGGVRVPISTGVDGLAMMQVFDLPVVVVTRPRLGTINHTLLTLDAIRTAGLTVAGLVVNGYEAANASIAEETVCDVLTEWGRAPILAVVPRDPGSDVESGRLGEAVVAALGTCDWQALIGG